MQVRQRLRINSIIPAVSTLIIMVMLSLAIWRVSNGVQAASLGDELLTASFERLLLRSDLLRTGSPRSLEQHAAKHAQVEALLKKARATFPDGEDRQIIAELLDINVSIGKIHRTIIENRKKSGMRPPVDPLSREVEDRLLSQLNMKVYENIMLLSRLQASSREAVSSSLQLAAAGILLMLVVVTVVTAAVSVTGSRAIAVRVEQLRVGAGLIGAGELDHRIDTTGDDEFADLARAINEMTARLRATYRDLELEIEERTRTQEELRQAKQAAEAASRTKSQFLANMSHELRTPMSGVLGMLELARATPANAEQRDFLDTALRSGRSLLGILNDILDLTRVESGNLALEATPFDLRKCLTETAEILLPEARRKGIALKVTLAQDLPLRVVGDQLRLRQILSNLSGNAVKFTERGEVEIRAALGGLRPDGSVSVDFAVQDTGVGIPREKKHLLFKPFSQVDDSHTRVYGGTGLGLAICKQLVERMDGSIGFVSEEGKGSTFSFTVPFRLPESAPAGETTPAVPAQQPPAAPARAVAAAGVLLVAEDDPVIRDVLGAMLRRSKFAADFAEDGEMAVRMWQEKEYDVVIMDVQMPRLDGFAATRVIRELEQSEGRSRKTPIIAMTAHAMKEDEDRCLAAGMDRYISKPIDFKECLRTVKELIAARQAFPLRRGAEEEGDGGGGAAR